MKVGQRLKHEVYGEGTILEIFADKKLGDGGWPDISQSSIIKQTNGMSRYDGNMNVTVRFDNGGPLGWALNSSNDIRNLQVIE